MQLKNLEKYKTIQDLQKALGLSSKAETVKWIYKNVPKEKHYQEKIIKYLRATYPHAVVWKENNGEYSSMNGIPDVTMIKDGEYYGFEVKRPFVGQLSKIQEKTIEKLREAGAKVYVVTYISDVQKVMRKS